MGSGASTFDKQTILQTKQVLEAGNNYHIVSVKGLELQETSCHSLEATRLVLGVVMGIHGHPSYIIVPGWTICSMQHLTEAAK